MKLEEIKEEMKVKVKETVDSPFVGETGEVVYIDTEDPENKFPVEVYFAEKEDIYLSPRDCFKLEELEKVFEEEQV